MTSAQETGTTPGTLSQRAGSTSETSGKELHARARPETAGVTKGT